MNTNYYNKYIKYKLKYLNLMKQTGGQFRNINVNGNVMTFDKDESDEVIILYGVKEVKPITVHDKKYINIYHNNSSDLLRNKQLLDKFYFDPSITVDIINYIIGLSGNNFVILEDIDGELQDKNPNIKRLVFLNNEKARKQQEIFINFSQPPQPSSLQPQSPPPHPSSLQQTIINDTQTNQDYFWNNIKREDSIIQRYHKNTFKELAHIIEQHPNLYVIVDNTEDPYIKDLFEYFMTIFNTIDNRVSYVDSDHQLIGDAHHKLLHVKFVDVNKLNDLPELDGIFYFGIFLSNQEYNYSELLTTLKYLES